MITCYNCSNLNDTFVKCLKCSNNFCIDCLENTSFYFNHISLLYDFHCPHCLIKDTTC